MHRQTEVCCVALKPSSKHCSERERETMPEEIRRIDIVIEAASGPHFSGLRHDGLASSSRRSSAPPTLTESNVPKQPFVIGNSLSLSLSSFLILRLLFSSLIPRRIGKNIFDPRAKSKDCKLSFVFFQFYWLNSSCFISSLCSRVHCCFIWFEISIWLFFFLVLILWKLNRSFGRYGFW